MGRCQQTSAWHMLVRGSTSDRMRNLAHVLSATDAYDAYQEDEYQEKEGQREDLSPG